MHRYVYRGGAYDNTQTENSPELPEFEDFDCDDGPTHRYVRTHEIDDGGYVVYRFVGEVQPGGIASASKSVSIAEDRARRIRIMEALVAAIDRRQEVLDLVCASSDPRAASAAIRDLLGVEDEPAQAVIDLQVRRFTIDARSRIADELADLRAQHSG